MDKKICIRDYAGEKQEISIPDFERVLCIYCDVRSGDEILFVTYDDGTEITFDSSDCRLHDYFDGRYLVYMEDVIDHLSEFSAGNTSYENLESFG